MSNKTNGQGPKYSIPQNSAGYVPAISINKKNPAPTKIVGKDLRTGK